MQNILADETEKKKGLDPGNSLKSKSSARIAQAAVRQERNKEQNVRA